MGQRRRGGRRERGGGCEQVYMPQPRPALLALAPIDWTVSVWFERGDGVEWSGDKSKFNGGFRDRNWDGGRSEIKMRCFF
jgi:hypothetical protein